MRDALHGRRTARPPRGELWVAPEVLAGEHSSGSPAGVADLARRLGADLSFVSCTGPLGLGDEPATLRDAVAAVHAAGLACGAVVDGPWQRLMQHTGLDPALRLTADAGFEPRLVDLSHESAREVDGWTAAGVELIVLADDVAHAAGPLFSPALFERSLVPHYRRLLDRARQTPMAFHADGDLRRLLPALVQAGFTSFSLEPEATAPDEVWRRYGRNVTLLTGIPAAWLTAAVDWPRVAAALPGLTCDGSLILASTCGLFEPQGVANLKTIYRLADAAAPACQAAARGPRAAMGAL